MESYDALCNIINNYIQNIYTSVSDQVKSSHELILYFLNNTLVFCEFLKEKKTLKTFSERLNTQLKQNVQRVIIFLHFTRTKYLCNIFTK